MTSPDPQPPGPEPEPPLPHQCCETACDPCIWTYHQRALAKWQERAAAWDDHCRVQPEDNS